MNQPTVPIKSRGTSPANNSGPLKSPANRGLTMFTPVASQSSEIVRIASKAGPGETPRKATR